MKPAFQYLIVASLFIPFTSCVKELGPVAGFSLTPREGNTTTEFFLDAQGSWDLTTPSEQLMYRWDWESDGTFDTDYSFQSWAQHTFQLSGETRILLEVTDQQGRVGVITHRITIKEGERGLFKDLRDNQLYKFQKAGSQIWMAQNLNFTTTGGSFIYNENPANAGIYGRLYTWETSRNVCPAGWHLPTDAEWMQFEKFATMMTTEAELTGCRGYQGMYLKSREGWPFFEHYNFNGDNSTGFTGLPGGYYRPEEGYDGLHYTALFWTSTETDPENAWSRRLVTGSEVCRDPSPKVDAYSVRCLKN